MAKKSKDEIAVDFLVGEVIKRFNGRVDPQVARKAIIRRLDMILEADEVIAGHQT